MYAPGSQYSNAASNFNNAAPPPNQQNYTMQQPGSVPAQPGQQQMMYNPNRFAMPGGAQGAAAPGPGGFPGQPNPGMMPGAGPAGMMQNTAMPQMAANGQMSYPNQFQGNAYPGGVPTTAGGQQYPPNYMAGGMTNFPMGQGMTPQQQQHFMHQRMQQQQAQQAAQQQAQQHMHQQQQQHPQAHPQQQQQPQSHPHQQQHTQQQQQHLQAQQQQQQQQLQAQQQQQQQQAHQQQHQQSPHQQQQQQGGMLASTPQRPPSSTQGSMGNMPPQQLQQQHQQQQQQQQMAQQQQQNQQHQNQPQMGSQAQPSSNAQQSQPSTNITTPQTPTFPQGAQNVAANGTPAVATPLSPGTESKEKDKFSLMLEINQELLFESVQIQNTIQEIKKEASDGSVSDGNRKSEEAALQQDYAHCMRRLQGNLSYLAALADRKGNVQVPAHPAYIAPPPWNLSIKLRKPATAPPASDAKLDPTADREERVKYIAELYLKLQALFPGVDPKTEPPQPPRPQGQPGGPQTHGQRPPGQQNTPVPQPQGPPQAMA